MRKRTNSKSIQEIPPPLRGRLGGGAGVGRMHLHRAEELQIRENARSLRGNLTDVERKLWRILRSRQLEGFRFRKQYSIDKYIADFACLERRLIIELDGGQYAEERKSYDDVRTAYLESQSFSVLRFWNNDVLQNPEGVIAVLLEQLQSPPTQPFPARGEGYKETHA